MVEKPEDEMPKIEVEIREKEDYDPDMIVLFGGKEDERTQRMTKREVYKPCIIYPENKAKHLWDIFVSILLVFTCFVTPWHICFSDDSLGWVFVNYTIDCMFLIDMIIIFNTAFQNDDFETVDDHKSIAIVYLMGWFWLDLIAVLPFQELLPSSNEDDGPSAGDLNDVARMLRLGRLSKLVKLMKLIRVIKFLKKSNNRDSSLL